MKIYSHIHKSLPFSLKLWGLLLIFTMGAFVYAQAQITIGGNVYGGGDMGDVSGNTQVQVLSGNIGTEDINNPGGSVFGGARVANVKGSTLVNIDGEHATDYIIINRVYGGNDISGTIGSYQAIGETEKFTALTTGSTPLLSNVGTSDGKDNVDASWNAFVHISDGGPDKRIYIGQLFGGGNGEYDYKSDNSPYKDMDAPELAKTYVDIQGGSIVYAYGGGNNATVTDQTVIHVDNPSQVVNSITQGQKELLNPARFKAMGINTGLSKPSSDAFQIGRLFGGNNLAAMNIRPTWNLRSGKVRNIYSGGNRGDMTHVEGLLLEIPAGSTIVVDDLFGGCRMADVNPLQPGTDTPADPSDIQLTEKNPDGTDKYDFAGGLSARVRISGGSVKNVYGGNDITGHVAGGNAVDIYHSIRGNVYGGGNGSYPYTDASSFKDDDVYGDLYYGDTFTYNDVEEKEARSLAALNDFRPDAEQVMIRLKGTESEHTYIDGSVFLGGNSATIKTTKSDPIVQLKMGSYVFAHNVFLGNNGEDMITYNEQDKDKDGNDSPGEMEGVLRTMKKTDYNSINLTNDNSFTAYMDGAAMDLIPTLTFFDDYVDYSSYIGSFYCGGNVGSMTYSGKNTMVFDAPIMISSKIVGGCNNAIVPKTEFNAYYDGGIMGSESEQISYLDESGNIKDRLVLNFNATKIEPWRWKMTTDNNNNVVYDLDTNGNRQIEWNTVIWDNDKHDFVQTDNTTVANDTKRRIADGNIYGGCYQSGHVNGNVVININSDIIDRDEVFAQTTTGNNGNVSISGQRNSGVILDEQSFDINIVALSAFGAGYGEKTEIWGSTTVNLNKGYVMQAYGGGHQGVVGKGEIQYTNDQDVIYELDENNNPTGYPEKEYEFDAKFSTTINLNATSAVYDEDSPALAEAEYLYGGGNEGNVCGNSYVYLGNGRIYDTFGGASNADILGHAETFIGRNSSGQTGFPYIRDIVYGGNDFGGTISGSFEDDYDFTKRVRDYANDKTIIHGYDATAAATSTYAPEVLKAAAYVEYLQGNVDTIFGGSYGKYDYSKTDLYGTDAKMPYVKSAFVNMRPQKNTNSEVSAIFGAGTGFSRNRLGDQSQDRSYVLIDIADDIDNFRLMQVYGAGSYNGLGMKPTFAETVDANYDRDNVSAIVDLVRGKIGSAYGGSYNEGVTRRTVVNIPQGSTINVGSIFGGAYGTHPLLPCDVYESNVNWSSSDAFLVASETAPMFYGAIYGGNNSFRQTVYSHIKISAQVNQNHYKYGNTTGYVYGAGEGKNTWARYTEVNLESGAIVYEAYGGGHNGQVINARTVESYMHSNMGDHSDELTQIDIDQTKWAAIWNSAWKLGGTGYDVENSTNTSLLVPAAYLVREAEMDERENNDPGRKNRYNTNVIVKEGAVVNNYLYGGGYGQDAVVSGSTYVALLGGVVNKDIYAAGTSGPVSDQYGTGFIASANAYIEGGTVRNVYGGGWRGSVGYAEYRENNDKILYNDGKTIVKEQIPDYYKNGAYTDRLGETHVVIGKKDGTTHVNGIPSIRRNVYGGGEGGAVYGTAYLTINNGYIGYQYKNTGTAQSPVYEYVEELDDAAEGDNLLAKYGGNAFGGGYVANSYVDNTFVRMYGGTIRGSLFGGGEIAPVGRGTVKADATNVDWQLTNGNGDEAKIYKAGKTHIEMYNGHVMRNVFGGGRGYDNWRNEGWMDPVELVTMDRSSKGYVFGQTEVCIYGGEIGTDEGVALGDGNVFGGGDEGYVYSAYMDNGQLRIGQKDGERYDGLYEGYYYQSNGTDYLTVNVGTTENPKIERVFTEDCKVLVEPWLQVKNTAITYDNKDYAVGDYVPTAYLNTLQAKSGDNWPAGWDNVDVGKSVTENNENVFQERGVIIHNAVFAGGNIASGSNSMHANETTVFGNATASIHDVYNRDFITIGTGHTGGLYGDGNLTFVDGYRELNITNYGSDKFHLATELTTANYKLLPAREKAYYELKYKARVQLTDNEQTTYSAGSTLPEDEIIALFAGTDKIGTDGKPSSTYWEANGVVSTYAGRIMNTIQRADFCGVFGSRMVMKGAQDRVAETADYHNYTINRVREVSLNKINSPAGDTDADNVLHGNYFGIYNTVNYLGSLTSDVDFHTRRTTSANTSNNSQLAEDGKTFYAWKEAHKDDRTRNNGNCHNQLALASGVYLELISEKSAGDDEKDWGLITGVVELDLINVQTGIGGGFVYAKNEHGVRSGTEHQNTTLTALNENAVTKWDFDYSKSDKKEWQTSGNFIHSSQTIIDDCYNEGGNLAMPAHYWFVSGQVYVYDQYISAYTGSPNAYSETVRIPITINAASNGKMTLVDVQPNLYAYYSNNNGTTINKLSGEQKLVINDVTYQLNTPISYWDWYKLPTSERNLFVEDTYITIADCKVGDHIYPSGSVMLKEDYNALKDFVTDNPSAFLQKKEVDNVVTYATPDEDFTFDYVFRSSNNLSHENGYILTYDVTNPGVWDQWYTKVDSESREKNQTGGTGYEDGPTYHPSVSGLYGQKHYDVSNIIPKQTYIDYEGYDANGDNDYEDEGDIKGLRQLHANDIPATGQAAFVPAYLVTDEYSNDNVHYYPGAAIGESISGYTAPAYVSTATIQLSATEFIYVNELMTEAKKTEYYNRFNKAGATATEIKIAEDINKLIVPAYYCSEAGDYAGSYYSTGMNYRGLEAWSSMSETDRSNFDFNYDALDLFIDPDYGGTSGKKYQYDGKPVNFDLANATEAQKQAMIYSLATPIDYTATYNGTSDETPHNGITLTNNANYSRIEYEKLPNEQRHYAAITVKAGETTYYVVKNDFIHVETPYATGTTVSYDDYQKLTSDEKNNITTLTFESSSEDRIFYYCRERYQVNEKGEGVVPTALAISEESDGGTETIEGKTWVKVGTIIGAESDNNTVGYSSLPNYQKNFTIHGVSPLETSTLYVSRNSDINDLSTEKVITVVYRYDYEESDASGLHITPVSERHVVNIHITFKSGVPIIDDISTPDIVIPGTSMVLREPDYTTGAYIVLESGWELFEEKKYAENHTNGIQYTPVTDPLYWYQDGYYLAFYTKTYLGKTYSNHVPISVANYHDLKKVMDDKKHHLYVDYDRKKLNRNSKIYINDYSEYNKNGLDLLKDFFDLSLLNSNSTNVTFDQETGLISSGNLTGHALLNTDVRTITLDDGKETTRGVKYAKNLEFILRTNIDHVNSDGTPAAWTSIASGTGENDPCFKGTLHGDGYTISGLTGSLFGKLCGDVYNLGVTGTFTGAGIAETGGGYVESCWVLSDATTPPAQKVNAVFGNPSRGSDIQLVNSYYFIKNNALYNNTTADGITTSGGDRGYARAMSEESFYNGELAYNLNSFYLNKRYYDAKGQNTGNDYKYLDNNTLKTGYYPNPIDARYGDVGYVEERYADGDYRYADGSIPASKDKREKVITVTTNNTETEKTVWAPVWPDDYIYFGQKLTYGYDVMNPHQDLPSHYDGSTNRVYRAPAYFGDSKMSTVHFNPDAVMAATSKTDATRKAYEGMTAFDLTGKNDVTGTASDYEQGLNSKKFYGPLLDYSGITSLRTDGLTQNLLAYVNDVDTDSKTVIENYFKEPDYFMYAKQIVNETPTNYDNEYRNILPVSTEDIRNIHGHMVVKNTSGNYVTTGDHFLVDYEDFNAPIEYTMGADQVMWYQRLPKVFVENAGTGWESISLPFTAKFVTTNQKGWITHFYEGSKIGHEYWLRTPDVIKTETVQSNNTETTINKLMFKSLSEASADDISAGNGANINYDNDFLWQHYYSNQDRKDKNDDDYQVYYKDPVTYNNYPFAVAANPYLIGFPGEKYYEFDMSGVFEAKNTATSAPAKIDAQTITFVSAEGISISKSDEDYNTQTGIENDTYLFKPTYQKQSGLTGLTTWLLDATGTKFENHETNDVETVPFRAYITKRTQSGQQAHMRSSSGTKAMASTLYIGYAGDQDQLEERAAEGGLIIYGQDMNICIESHLEYETKVTVHTVAGNLLKQFTIQPGTKVQIPVNNRGVYIVNHNKVAVTK